MSKLANSVILSPHKFLFLSYGSLYKVENELIALDFIISKFKN